MTQATDSPSLNAQGDTVQDLRRKVESLEARLCLAQKRDGSCRVAQRNLERHWQDLFREFNAVQAVAKRLDGTGAALFPHDQCASQIARTVSVFWVGNIFTYWLRTSFKLSKSASHVLLAITLISAVLPLGFKGCKRLRSLLVHNPRLVDELRVALAAMEERLARLQELPTVDTADARPEPSPPVDVGKAVAGAQAAQVPAVTLGVPCAPLAAVALSGSPGTPVEHGLRRVNCQTGHDGDDVDGVLVQREGSEGGMSELDLYHITAMDLMSPQAGGHAGMAAPGERDGREAGLPGAVHTPHLHRPAADFADEHEDVSWT